MIVSQNEQLTIGQLNCVRDKATAELVITVYVSTQATNVFRSHRRINES
jgi:hypothetical protein